MKLAFAVVVALTSVVAAPSAAAKGPSTLLVCGPGGCLGTRDRAALAGFGRYLHGQTPRRAPPAPVGPYYELRGELRHHVTYGFFVPGAASFSVYFTQDDVLWRPLSPALRRELERLAARLRPFAKPSPYELLVEDRRIAPATPFVRLLGPLPRAPAVSSPAGFRWLSFGWERPCPWSRERLMRYYPLQRTLYRSGEWVRVPEELARRLG